MGALGLWTLMTNKQIKIEILAQVSEKQGKFAAMSSECKRNKNRSP